jgi:hypothetical protein
MFISIKIPLSKKGFENIPMLYSVMNRIMFRVVFDRFSTIMPEIHLALKTKVLWDTGLLLYSVRITSHFTALPTDVVRANM